MLAAAARSLLARSSGSAEQLLAPLTAGFAKAAASKEVAAPAKMDWKAVKIPEQSKDTPETVAGQAFAGDLRSTSALVRAPLAGQAGPQQQRARVRASQRDGAPSAVLSQPSTSRLLA